MRLSGPTLRDNSVRFQLRSLRVFLVPALLALALYAFFMVGRYRDREITHPPLAHGGIYGVVINDKQHPVPRAAVTISFTSVNEPVPDAAPPTDSQGRFYISDLPAGNYILQATAEGFNEQTQQTLVEPGKTTRIRIPLYPVPGFKRTPNPPADPTLRR